MGTELRSFKGGGMDSDSSPDSVQAPDYISAYNARVTGTAEGEDGDLTNIESTVAIEGERGDGINKAIGAQGFEILRKGLVFVYNSNSLNQIIEIDYDTDTETILYTNKTDSGGENILPLNPQFYVTDIKLIGDFYVFTDGNMQPCYISRARLLDGSYGVLTEDDFLLIKAQILVPPTATYNDDASRSVNLLSGNLFQFRNQVVYLDNEYSALSSISKRPVPTSEGTPAIGTDVTKNNNIIVSTHIGSSRGSRLIVSARVGELDWFTIKDKNRADILAITDTEVDVANEIYEAYDPATGLYSFAFYNDTMGIPIDVLETDLLADTVPLKAETLEVLNGNVLALAGLTEGYLRPSPTIALSVGSYQPDIAIENPDGADALAVTYSQYRPSNKSYREVEIRFSGIAKVGDEITIVVGNLNGTVYYTITYPVPASADGNTLEAVKGLATQITQPTNYHQSGSVVILRFPTRGDDQTPDGGREQLLDARIDLANAGTGASKSVSSLKTNSSYQLALAHYDKWGRPFPIATNDDYIIKTQSYSQLQGQAPLLNWEITSAPPEGAVSAQWLLSKNTTHESTLYVAAKIQSSTAQYITLNINSLKEFNEGNDASILSYDFTANDRCAFHYYDNAGTLVWLNNPSIDTEVVGFEIEVDETPDPDVTNYLLKVRRSSQLDVTAITDKNILIEIYTPRKRVVTASDGEVSLATTVFYEIGNQINIVDGAYEITSGQITDGDSYFKTRQLENAIDATLEVYEVESFHFSDFYISNYTSYGRPRSYYDVDEFGEKKASIRYSDVFRLGSEVNGITRFYPERIYGEGDGETSSDFGWINKIRQRDNYLVCIQEYKIWHIPIFTSILEDQTSQQNIAISDRILGQARGLQSGKYGMGGAKTSYAESKNGTIYFVDPNNSMPLRDGYDGVKPIAGKMSKFFKRVLQQAKKDGKKIIGWFDEYNQEYVVAIETLGDILTSFTFNSTDWSYLNTYTIPPASLAITVEPTKGTVVLDTLTGNATYRSDPNESGADSYTFTFVVDGNTITKRKCFDIDLGDTTPFEFVFVDLTGQPLSTLTESNQILVAGINVPVAISITGGEYQITRDGVDLGWTSVSGYVESDDVVTVRHTTSGSYGTTVDSVLTVSTVSDTFSTTTITNPDPFTFTDVTDAELVTLYESNIITPTGLTGATPISITGEGQYRINGGVYTSATGTISPGDTVQVRRESSGVYSTETNTLLTIGEISDTYNVTTKVDPTPVAVDTPSPSACSVFINDSDSKIYTYEVATATSTFRIDLGTSSSSDVAHTSTKLFYGVYVGARNGFDIFDITFSPFTMAHNKRILLPTTTYLGTGFTAKDNNNIIMATTLEDATSSVVQNVDVSGSGDAVVTTLFSLPVGRFVLGDVLYNAITDTYIISNGAFADNFITEFSSTGVVLTDIPHAIPSIWGLFEDSGNLYGIKGSTKEVYQIETTGLTLIDTITGVTGADINGASQTPSCITFNF